MKMHDQKVEESRKAPARPFARVAARELTQTEMEAIAGGRPSSTNATGPNGDDPADPGTLV